MARQRERRRRRLAVGVAAAAVVAAVAVVGSVTPRTGDGEVVAAGPTAGGDVRRDLGEGSWLGARTSENGQRLVIALIGGRPYEPGDPCTSRYTASVTETPREVRVVIDEWSPRASGDHFCTGEGHNRTVEVPLAAAFGDRQLIDVRFGREQPVFDGSQLVEPSGPFDHWTLQGEAPAHPRHLNGWSRTWAPPRPEPSADGCTQADAGVTILQGPGEIVDEYRSRPAVYRGWVADGVGYVLLAEALCEGDRILSDDEVQQFAASLVPSGSTAARSESVAKGSPPASAATFRSRSEHGELPGNEWELVIHEGRPARVVVEMTVSDSEIVCAAQFMIERADAPSGERMLTLLHDDRDLGGGLYEYELTWDGTTDTGERAPSGRYRLTVSFTSSDTGRCDEMSIEGAGLGFLVLP